MRVLLGLVIVVVASCSKSDTRDVISKDEFTAIMVDVHLAEAAVLNLRSNTDTARNALALYYGRVFESHGTTQDLFNKSFDYYLNQPTVMVEIYEQALAELTALEVKWSSGQPLDE